MPSLPHEVALDPPTGVHAVQVEPGKAEGTDSPEVPAREREGPPLLGEAPRPPGTAGSSSAGSRGCGEAARPLREEAEWFACHARSSARVIPGALDADTERELDAPPRKFLLELATESSLSPSVPRRVG